MHTIYYACIHVYILSISRLVKGIFLDKHMYTNYTYYLLCMHTCMQIMHANYYACIHVYIWSISRLVKGNI